MMRTRLRLCAGLCALALALPPLPAYAGPGPGQDMLTTAANAAATALSNLNAAVSGHAYGMKCDGATDDTAALQNAVNAAEQLAFPAAANGGAVLQLPPGFCMVETGSISITSGVTIVGAGIGANSGVGNSGGTVVRTTSATADVFDVVTDDPVTFENFMIDTTVTKTAGAGISITGADTAGNVGSHFVRMTIKKMWNGIAAADATDFTVTDSLLKENLNDDLLLAPDSSCHDGCSGGGGFKVVNSMFYNANSAGTCNANIEYQGGGPVMVSNSKFLGCAYNYLVNLQQGATGTLLLTGNSFEEARTASVAITQGVSGKEFGNLAIVGNEFSSVSNNPADGNIYIGTGTPTSAPKWVRNVNIADNHTNNTVALTAGQIEINDGTGISIAANVLGGNVAERLLGGLYGSVNWPSVTGGGQARILASPSVAQNTTAYFSVGPYVANAGAGPSALEPQGGTLANLEVSVVAAPAAGQTYTFTVYAATAYGLTSNPTALTCQITGGNKLCSDTTHDAVIQPGGTWTVQVTTSATSGSTGVINASAAMY